MGLVVTDRKEPADWKCRPYSGTYSSQNCAKARVGEDQYVLNGVTILGYSYFRMAAFSAC